MYSLVLMTAVATSGDASAFNWRSGGCGGCSCSGSAIVYQAAPVAYTVGCYGSPSYAVGSCFGCRGSTGCTGCNGCWGRSFYRASCHGCTGSSCCGGSCFGSSCCGGSCFGSYATPIVIPAVEDCCGATPTVTTPAVPTSASPTESPANLKIDLPADAKLYVDGQLVPGGGATRTFATPKLPAGRSFAYEMRAEISMDGSTVTEEMKVVVHAGDDVTKSFGKLLAAANREKPTAVAKK
jgi:uncharacterized protein (TIGR03000 family)